jgi:hypothetical protein
MITQEQRDYNWEVIRDTANSSAFVISGNSGIRGHHNGCNSSGKPTVEGEYSVFNSPYSENCRLVDKAVRNNYGGLSFVAVPENSREYWLVINEFDYRQRSK